MSEHFESHTDPEYIADDGVLDDLDPGAPFEIAAPPSTLVL